MLYFKGFLSDEASKMAQSVKVPATKSNNLSFIPRTKGIRRSGSCKLFSNLHVRAHTCENMHISTQIIQKIIIYNLKLHLNTCQNNS